jgi:catechol 2,3-dioxygenase-like lactoylglutathione lyase family enzyme
MNSNGSGAGAPASSAVDTVVIGAENLDASLEFYVGTLGLEVTETRTWEGSEFESHWKVPAGTKARCAFIGHGADPVGRIQLMEFDAPNRKRVRPSEIHRATGLFNLNIYSSDIDSDVEKFKALGFSFWTDPLRTDFGPAVGEISEVACDGPDGIVINLVQLLTEDPKTLSGHILKFIEGYGRTATGFTSVATTSHGVIDMEKAMAFYYGPLKMTLFMDTVLEGVETNRTMGLAEDAQTRSVFVQGDHEYGKIALSAPMNYEVPDITPNAVAPNIGYLAQSFQIADIDEAASACAAVGAEEYTAPVEIELPGRGKCAAMLVRNPGSGALQELFQVL